MQSSPIANRFLTPRAASGSDDSKKLIDSHLKTVKLGPATTGYCGKESN
jgi:hypothetical protein